MSIPTIDKGRALQVLGPSDADKLLQFYLRLGFRERRVRFGAAVSDESIQRFCRAIDWNQVVVVGRVRAYCLESVIEIHPLSAAWDIAEIALASAVPIARGRILAELLQIGAFAAGRRGCATLTMPYGSDVRELMPLLSGMGHLSFDGDHMSVDIGDYVLGGRASDR